MLHISQYILPIVSYICFLSHYTLPILLRGSLKVDTNPPFQYAQELLSTFSSAIGEIALIPSNGGVFTVDIVHAGLSESFEHENNVSLTTFGFETTRTRLWDRKTEGGFPGM